MCVTLPPLAPPLVAIYNLSLFTSVFIFSLDCCFSPSSLRLFLTIFLILILPFLFKRILLPAALYIVSNNTAVGTIPGKILIDNSNKEVEIFPLDQYLFRQHCSHVDIDKYARV